MTPAIDDAGVERRAREQKQALKAHWSKPGWKPFNPDSYEVTFRFWLTLTWDLLRCKILGHDWNDSHFCLYGEPGDWRHCDRCFHAEILQGEQPDA